MQQRLSTTLFMLGLAATTVGLQIPAPAQSAPDFNRQIKPILLAKCLRCHDSGQAQGGIRLDSLEAATKSRSANGRAVVPHNAAASQLIQRVSATGDQRMPPAYSGLAPLTKDEVALLTAWIDAGPAWGPAASARPGVPSTTESHWSLRALRRPSLPTTAGNPIDAFVHAKLAAKGLMPSAPADRKTLLRRVTWDLTGLPPTPDETAAFVADRRPDAYLRVVDGLLNSPRYGERWARHWLDTIHYADSHGFEHDIGRDNGWPFRDYVIDSLNHDTLWPRFIREQLAADYFFPDRPELTPALGYLGAGTFDLSAYTTAPRNFALIDRDDLVTQTMSAFVSTTANCARCHNHKFDPIPQTDYYALQAVFAGITKGDRSYEASPEVGAQRKQWATALAAANDTHPDPGILLSSESRERTKRWLSGLEKRTLWSPGRVLTAASEEGSTLTINADGTVTSGGVRPATDTYNTTIACDLKTITALRLDVLSSTSLPMHGPGRQDNGNLHLSEIEVRHVDLAGNSEKIKITSASADFNQDGWGIQRAIDGDIATAWGIYPQVGKSHYAIFRFAAPVQLRSGSRILVALRQKHGGGHLIGLYRLTFTDSVRDAGGLTALPVDVELALQTPAAGRTQQQQMTIAAEALREEATDRLGKLPLQAKVYAAGPSVEVSTLGMVTIASPSPMHLLERGDIEKPRQVVDPGALSAVTVLPARFALNNPNNEAARRAALADWLANRDNPLTWRSIVNRVWHYHFGKGICDTPGDFGRMGGEPSHPEMLDWLAIWFRDDAKGSIKKLHKLIVTSQTYCQSSANRPDAARADSDNRLLWRQNRQRLDADSYRDFARAVSGSLDFTMGGPGVKHFTMKPGPQLTPALDYAAYDWNAPGSNRRSIYRTVWRGIPDPFMDALDFPDLGLLAPSRTFSVSSLQALALYNNGFVLHCSELLALALEKEKKGPAERVEAAARRVWLRLPTAAESAKLQEYARQYGLPALCRVLLNSNEFLFVD